MQAWQKTLSVIESYYVHVIYLVSLTAVLGSLYFSEVQGLAPCPYCWWQRIAMYPLALITLVALGTKDSKVWKYTLPLSIIGNLIAIYHVIYQASAGSGLPSCGGGANSCANVDFALLGFITIPLMSAAAFTLMNVVTLLAIYNQYKAKEIMPVNS